MLEKFPKVFFYFAEIWKKSKVSLWCYHGIIKTSSWCFVNGKCHDDVLMMPWWHHNGTFDFYKKNYILESMIMASWWRDEGIMLASWKNFIWRHFQKCHYDAFMMPLWCLSWRHFQSFVAKTFSNFSCKALSKFSCKNVFKSL